MAPNPTRQKIPNIDRNHHINIISSETHTLTNRNTSTLDKQSNLT